VAHKIVRPGELLWEPSALSLLVVVQGSLAVEMDTATVVIGPSHYFVQLGHIGGNVAVVDASPASPLFAIAVEIKPGMVRRLSAGMAVDRNSRERARSAAAPGTEQVSTLTPELLGVLSRLVRAVGSSLDREALAPLYVEELVYRVLQGEQQSRLIALAAREAAADRLAPALAMIHADPSVRIRVPDLAARSLLSVSSFSALFRTTTGRSPYEYVKEVRLDRARLLLLEGRFDVAEVSRQVGYSSPSHFITQFRARFGVTPRSFAVDPPLAWSGPTTVQRPSRRPARQRPERSAIGHGTGPAESIASGSSRAASPLTHLERI
jgi:AraC-like DNA-binding protein